MKKINLILLSLAFILFPIFKANAFSLYYNEAHKNDAIEVEINITRDAVSPKAVEGYINFNPESFELVKIIQNNLTIDKWITAPYLIESGKLFFSGTFNPNSNRNDLFTLVFKKNSDNKLNLNICSSTILGEDDKLYDLQEIFLKKENSLSIFNVTSSTHSDPESWYSNKNVELKWQLPSDAEKIKILIDKNEFSYPSVEYDKPINIKNIELDDGIWYFHIRYFGNNGWSSIEHRKIMIDTQKPILVDIKNEKGTINFFGQDELSGIDLYEIDIPALNQKYIIGEEVFKLPQLKSGIYDIKIRAYDKAQNYIEINDLLEIKGIDPPHFSGLILGNEELFILGYVNEPKSKVYASINGSEASFSDATKTSEDGKFVHSIQKLTPGLYDLQLMTITDDGISEKNKKIILVVSEKIVFNSLSKVLIACGLIILISISFYIFLKKDNKKTKKRRVKKNKK